MALAMARERLLTRSGHLRQQVADQSAALMPALALADRGRDAARWLRAHPAWVAAALSAALVARPRAVWRWGLRAWSAWQLVRRWRRRVEGLMQLF